MKTLRSLAIICSLLLFVAGAVQAGVYTFTPSPFDLYDLDHHYYYTWGISWAGHADETITEAVLKYTNIWDWVVEPNDYLYTHLLDNPPAGVKQYYDNQLGGDDFLGQGAWVGTWSDPNGGDPSNSINLTYKFSELGLLDDLQAYAADGVFGFGIDPDCHYWNDDLKFTVTTTRTCVIPEPMSVMLGLAGLGAVAGFTRLRRK